MHYRERRPATRLLVLADHETGGLAVGSREDGGPVAAYWATADSDTVADHTANLVPHFAVGPGTDRFRGLHTVAWTGRRLLEMVGGPELPAPFPDEVR